MTIDQIEKIIDPINRYKEFTKKYYSKDTSIVDKKIIAEKISNMAKNATEDKLAIYRLITNIYSNKDNPNFKKDMDRYYKNNIDRYKKLKIEDVTKKLINESMQGNSIAGDKKDGFINKINPFNKNKTNEINNLLNESIELINKITPASKVDDGDLSRIWVIYENLNNRLTKKLIKNDTKLAGDIIKNLKLISTLLKNKGIETKKKDKKELLAKEKYYLKIEDKRAGSPLEIYNSAKNRALSIMDKGLRDEKSLLDLSMLLDEMRSAYEEDNDTGGSKKLHIAECNQDFNTIEAYLKRNKNNSSDVKTIAEKIEEMKNGISSMLPKENGKIDSLLSPLGTTEREGEEKLIEFAKEVNSSHKIANSIKIMQVLGRIGLVVSIFILIFGVSFDLEYHLPKLHEFIGDFLFYLLAFFITILIASLLHIPLESYVNRRWNANARKYIVMSLFFSIPAILYIDYRAVQNYAKQVADIKISQEMNNTTNAIGVMATNAKNKLNARQKEIDKYNSDIDKLKERNNNLLSFCDNLQAKITKIDNKKRRTRRDNNTRWRLAKTIKQYKKEIASNKGEIKLIEKKIEKEQAYLDKSQNELLSVAKKIDDKKDVEARNRAIMMYVLIALIDFSSMLKIYADFINNKNLPINIDDIYRVNNMLDSSAIFRNYSSTMIANQGVGLKQSLEVDGFTHQAILANALEQKANSLQNVAMLGDVVRETSKQHTELLLELTQSAKRR